MSPQNSPSLPIPRLRAVPLFPYSRSRVERNIRTRKSWKATPCLAPSFIVSLFFRSTLDGIEEKLGTARCLLNSQKNFAFLLKQTSLELTPPLMVEWVGPWIMLCRLSPTRVTVLYGWVRHFTLTVPVNYLPT